MPGHDSLGAALAAAVARVRERLGDPVAPVLVVTPADGNAVLARQQLSLAGDFIRVEFAAPERVVRELGHRALEGSGLRPEPKGWLPATVGAIVGAGLLGRYGPVLAERGWRGALAGAVEALESAGVSPDRLARMDLPAHTERIALLVRLLAAVAERRSAERLYTTADLCRAASGAVAGGRWSGVVILGDRLLPPTAYAVLRDWLALRPVVQVVPDAWARLDPAPRGLRDAAAGTEVLGVAATGAEVVLVRTADDVRELHEAAREAVDAVTAGVALDRIAIVLPDPSQVEVLRAALDQAHLHASWHVGSPLAQTPAGRFLLHALDVATGADTVPDWYELLRQPGLRWQRAGEPDVRPGKTRWRRILSQCGAVADVDRIIGAVAAWSAGQGDPAQEPSGDRTAAANLIRALQALKRAVGHVRPAGTLGEHGARWVELVRGWWPATPDRERLLSVLYGLGGPGLGPRLTVDSARDLLRDVLEAAPVHEGAFTDAALRVVSPMGLLGGAFERVIVTGLVEGRLPRAPQEDVLLPDALIAGIRSTLQVDLQDSRAVRDFEDRRLAAIRASCVGRLWLSTPATEHLAGRPLTPSRFALDLASELAGQRVGYRALPRHQQLVGSRARAGAVRSERALGGLEHQVGQVREDPSGALERLAGHPIARRLLGLQLALGSEAPSVWTGQIDPAAIAVPGLDGQPQSAWALALLLRDPSAFLAQVVLGIHRTSALYGSSDPFSPRVQLMLARDALAACDGPLGPTDEAYSLAWEQVFARWRAHRSDVTDAMAEPLRRSAGLLLRIARSGGAIPAGARVRPEGKPVEALPWAVRGDEVWLDGEVVGELRSKRPPRANQLLEDAGGLVLSAMCHPGAVSELRIAVVEGGQTVSAELEPLAAVVRTRLAERTVEVRAGRWPRTRPPGARP